MENECKSLSKTWRKMGGVKIMPFKEFAQLYNQGGQTFDLVLNKLDEIEEKNKLIKTSKPLPQPNKSVVENAIVCKKEGLKTIHYVAIGALLIAGIYLIAKNKKD